VYLIDSSSIQVAGNNSAGSASNQLNYPWGIYVDGNKTLYIVDSNNHRVQKWLQGTLICLNISI
jgi:DNA-binding beta-propeller fold protein YncE